MRSIGNDVKSSSNSSSITQTHLDDLDEARDTHQAAAIATESTARNTAIITAVATETAARNTAIASETTARNTAIAELNTYQNNARVAGLAGTVTMITAARNTAIATETTARNTAITTAVASETTARNTAIATAHTEIVTDGYFDKIITSTTNISNMGFTNPDAAFAHKSHANVLSYALRQDQLGETFINTANGKNINFSIDGAPKATIKSTNTTFNTQMTIKNAIISDAGFAANMAVFSHKDMDNTTDYGFMQDPNGTTYINAKTGNGIMFRINNIHACSFTNNMAYYTVPILTTTAEISQAGWDTNNIGGTMAVFSHNERANVNDYGFMQHSAGTTYINSGDALPNNGTAQVNIRTNNVNVATFKNSVITFIAPTSGSSDRRFKKNITTPAPSKNWNDFKLIEIKQYNKVYPNINSDKLRLGVIAQELEAIDNPICKNAVREISIGKTTDPVELAIYKQGTIYTDDAGEERSGGFRTVEYEQLYRMNLIITQQLMARVEALEAALSKKN